MKPQTESVGIILTSEEADFAISADEHVYAADRARGVPENSCGRSIDLGIIDEGSEILFNELQVRRLWGVVYTALNISILSLNKMRADLNENEQPNTLGLTKGRYLGGLRFMIDAESENIEALSKFMNSIRDTRRQSRKIVSEVVK